MTHHTPIALGGFALTVALLCGTAHAQTPDLGLPTNAGAIELLEQGNRHYRVGEFDKTAELYKQGALIEDAPVFLYNLGQCHRQLGDHKQAIWHYERFLDRKKDLDPEIRMYVKNFIDVAKAALEQEAKDHPPTEPGGTDSAGEIGIRLDRPFVK